jgi:hypothetical protein
MIRGGHNSPPEFDELSCSCRANIFDFWGSRQGRVHEMAHIPTQETPLKLHQDSDSTYEITKLQVAGTLN